MTDLIKQDEYWLTLALYNARAQAGTLVPGAIYHITDVTYESTSNKTTTITSSSTDVQYPTAKLLYDTRQDLKEIAEGKTNSYVVSKATNPAFDTQDASFQLTGTFTDIKGISHNVTDLKLGDNIYVLETDVPDRWCSDPQEVIPVVPEGYTLLQYIQSSGTQYINTGWIPSVSNFGIKFKFNRLNIESLKAPCGSENNTDTWRWLFTMSPLSSTSGNMDFLHGKLDYLLTTAVILSGNTDYTIDWNYNGTTKKSAINISGYNPFNINGAAGEDWSTIDTPLNIFCNTTSQMATQKVYYFQCLENGVAVRNFIPAKRNSDDHIGFWDTVTETFFENAGTGEFTGGELPEGVTLYKLETAKVPVQDVQIGGTTIVNNSIANIPYATNATVGISRTSPNDGISIGATHQLMINLAGDAAIESKANRCLPIVPYNLNKAVMEGLGNNTLTWSSQYLTSARTTIGAAGTSDLPNVVRL